MDKRVFTLSVVLGVLIWALSPILAGNREPWDAEGSYYTTSLFVAGLVPALIEPKQFLVWPVGVYVGQVLFIVGASFLGTHTGANLAVVGIIMMLFYMVPTVIGAVLGMAIRDLVEPVRTRFRGKLRIRASQAEKRSARQSARSK